MLAMIEALQDLVAGDDEQSSRAFKQTIDTPAGPLAVMIIYPKPVAAT